MMSLDQVASKSDAITSEFSDVSATTRRKIRRRIGHLTGNELTEAINNERHMLEKRRAEEATNVRAAQARRVAEEARIKALPAKDQPPYLCPGCYQLRKASRFTGVPGGVCRSCYYDSFVEWENE